MNFVENERLKKSKKVRKLAKWCVFSVPNLRTAESIANLIKKTDLCGRFDFWQGHLCNSRADFIRDVLQFGKEIKIFFE